MPIGVPPAAADAATTSPSDLLAGLLAAPMAGLPTFVFAAAACSASVSAVALGGASSAAWQAPKAQSCLIRSTSDLVSVSVLRTE